jgi:ATP-dependent DNA helicase RecG
MKAAERAATMDAFRAGQIDLLVSTTVIEVGVDVPNATVMVIEDADRFGLAQLHQLRGRVGRGEHPSFCLLISHPKHNPFSLGALDGQSLSDGQRRMKVMVETTDGFRIAEEDLQIRGPGEVYGTRQHGFDALGSLRIANVLRDQQELEAARRAAFRLVAEDPQLTRPEHAGLRRLLRTPRPAEMVAVG